MKRLFTFRFSFLFAFLVVAGGGYGQTTLAFQGFEGGAGDTWTIVAGNGNISNASGAGDTPANSRIRTGSYSWQVNNQTSTLELSSFALSGQTNVKVIVHLSSTSGTAQNGADGGDYVKAYVNLDGAGFPTTADVAVMGNSNAKWDYNAVLTAATTAGTPISVSAPQGGTNSNNYATIEINIPDGSSSVALKLIVKNDHDNEYWNIDDIELREENDQDSEAADPTTQIAAKTISSLADTDAEAVDVFSFDLIDWGTSDGLPTKVTRLKFIPAASNTADWATHIQGVKIDDGFNFLLPSSVSITSSSITIDFPAGTLDVPDGNIVTATLWIYLNTSGIEDGKVLSFMIPAMSHGLLADAAGSGFASAFSADVVSNDMTIGVDGTELRFTVQPSDVDQGAVMAPAVEVSATDANGNVDVDFDGSGFDIALTTTGTFDPSATTQVSASMGVAVFNNLIFSAPGTGLTLTADDVNDLITSSTYVSNTFDVLAVSNPGDIIISEWMANPCTNDPQGEYVELYNTTGTDIDIDGWVLKDAGSDSHTINNGGSLIVPANGYLVLASNNTVCTNAGYVYSGFLLANGADEIILARNGTQICRVDYLDGDPYGQGKSAELYDLSLQMNGVTNAADYWEAGTAMDASCNSGGCSAYGTPGVVNAPLPITLLSFEGAYRDGQVLLAWATAVEVNNDYMLVERSADGVAYEAIGRVEGKGTTYVGHEYAFTDLNPLAGANYYRLCQVDFDGSKTYHQPIVVKTDGELSIFPTLTQKELYVQSAGGHKNAEQWLQYHIFNLQGKELLQGALIPSASPQALPVSDLPQGMYVLRWQQGGSSGVFRFLVCR